MRLKNKLLRKISKADVNKYLAKNYQWVIGVLIAVIAILVSVITVPWGVNLANRAEEKKESEILKTTSTYYFTPANSIETAEIEDGANCWTSSGSSSRTDAYRCTLNNNIYDPCFYQTTFNFVDCPPEPNEHKIITVQQVERNTPKDDDEINQVPWYVVLEDKEACRYINGVTDIVADKRVDYGCKDQKKWLSLPIENENGLLKIRCFNSDLNRIEICKIKEAWY